MNKKSKSKKAAPSTAKETTDTYTIGERRPGESPYFRGRTPKDHPIFKAGWIIGGCYPGRPAGPSTEPSAAGPDAPAVGDASLKKRTGIVSWHEGEFSSRPDQPAILSFGYFRTKSGRPPEVEAREAKAAEAEDRVEEDRKGDEHGT
ncbi:MAG: hypothetical protein WC859_03310 [Elusimicrobiota bacterium]|jgi:hypothetical protein